MGKLLYLVEFAYNNGYHSSLHMSLFEALYGRKCNTPISWGDSSWHGNNWARTTQRNGRAYGKNQAKFESGIGQMYELCKQRKSIKII